MVNRRRMAVMFVVLIVAAMVCDRLSWHVPAGVWVALVLASMAVSNRRLRV